MRTRVMLTAATLCVMALGVAAQSRPDFAGTWELDLERTRAENRARSGGAGGGGMGGSMAAAGAAAGPPAVTAVRITQTATELTISRVSGQVWDKVVHRLDGAESVSANGRSVMKLKSRWDGPRLVSEGTSESELPDGGGVIGGPITEVRWLDADGVMVVESTRVVKTPPTMQVTNPGQPIVRRQYFVKK